MREGGCREDEGTRGKYGGGTVAAWRDTSDKSISWVQRGNLHNIHNGADDASVEV